MLIKNKPLQPQTERLQTMAVMGGGARKVKEKKELLLQELLAD